MAEIQNLMSANVGVFRDADGLRQATRRLDAGWQTLIARVDHEPGSLTVDDWRTASLLTVGRLVARAAWRREESRGGHYRLDHPDRDDRHWKRRLTEARRRTAV